MTCAKKIVKCTIITENGLIFSGDNSCVNPQTTCPRLPDEGYEKCKSICLQNGHAEEMALLAAGENNLYGATAYMSGTTHFCESCQKQLFDAGVKYLSRETV